jgi:hypothetical protein
MDNYENPKDGKTYISPGLDGFRDKTQKVRIATKAITSDSSYAFATMKGEIVLRHKEGAKSVITAKFLEDDRGVFILSIQRYALDTGVPRPSPYFTFVGEEVYLLLKFLNSVRTVCLDSPSAINCLDEKLPHVAPLSKDQIKKTLHKNPDLLAELLRSDVTTEDLVAVGYRKKQIDVFEKLLNNNNYFDNAKKKKECHQDEGLWQKYFEKNPWIFGYGLGYIFLSGLDEKKLEQV